MGNDQLSTRRVAAASIETYRYVRAAIVGSVLLLFVAVGLQVMADGAVLSSISAYYYGPVRSVLVGILVATGLALVAIKGRPGVEDISLNLAGMLAPVVAFVPTPLLATEGTCPDGLTRCIPAEFMPGVENNMAALILVGPVVLVVAWWASIRLGTMPRSARLSLSGATVVWLVFALWFFLGPRDPFLEIAHYAAAGAMFALIIVVVWYNALRTDQSFHVAQRSVSYQLIYLVIAILMSLSLLTAVVFYVATGANFRLGFPWIFVLETILLVLFTLFWVTQTHEFWNKGLPTEAQRAPLLD